MPFTAFGHSDTGRQRSSNEDQYVCLRIGEPPLVAHVVAVADGMGGHAGGQIASGLAISALEAQVSAFDAESAEADAEAMLEEAFRAANREILRIAASDRSLADMGTTMVAGIVSESGATLANLGDSRAYLTRNGIIGQITVDHSWREEAKRHNLPLDEIAMSPFRETITRSLGVDDSVKVDIVRFGLQPGDCILLCSDGVHDLLSDAEMLAVIVAEKTPESVGKRLVELANEAGGHDNSTCVLIRYDGPGAMQARAPGNDGSRAE